MRIRVGCDTDVTADSAVWLSPFEIDDALCTIAAVLHVMAGMGAREARTGSGPSSVPMDHVPWGSYAHGCCPLSGSDPDVKRDGEISPSGRLNRGSMASKAPSANEANK